MADFTDGQPVFPSIAEKLENLDIGVLINNVGLSYVHPEYFLEVPKEVSITYNLQTVQSYTSGHKIGNGLIKCSLQHFIL